jgi:carnitine-CoA ligase
MDSRDVLPVLISQHAREMGDKLFLETAEAQFSYREVHNQSLRWSRALADIGVRAGDTVATLLPVSPEGVIAWLAISWIRGIEVPINTEYRGRILEYVISDSKADVLICHTDFLEGLGELEPRSLPISKLILVGDEGVEGPGSIASQMHVNSLLQSVQEVVEEPNDRPRPHDISTIMYTSGTTGPSKGVMVPWAQVHATSVWTMPLADLDASDKYYVPYPLFHIAGKLSIYTMALVGGSVFLRRRFNTEDFWNEIREYQCTTVILLGAVANFLYRQPPSHNDSTTPLTNVLMVPLIPEVNEFAERFDVRICTCFNMTEISSPIVSMGWELANSSYCGRVRPGVECRLVDEFDCEVGIGDVGELVVRSDEPWRLNAGYWNKPEKTVEAWRNQWLHTGDAFRRDQDGNFYFVDRMKDAIRRRGENISSLEVELEINAAPGVLESAVVGVPSEWGEEEVLAIVVPKPGVDLDPKTLHAYLSARMTKFMVPRYIRVVDQLPKTPTQKIRKVGLRSEGLRPEDWDSSMR